MDVETVADQLFFSTVYVKATGRSGQWTGTGFAYLVETDKGRHMTLVSNKHVLGNADVVELQFVAATSSSASVPAMGRAATITVTEIPSAIEEHPDAAVDVAVMPLGGIIGALDRGGTPAFCRAIPAEMALTDAKARELDAIEDVLFVGYPNGIFDTANFTPVARKGTTATPVVLDYRGEPAFLVDASVYPGSSGSPVFILNTGTYAVRNGGTVVGTRVILLGIIAAVHTAQVGGRVVTLPAQRAVEVDAPIGLGIVYKARAIDEVVDQLLARDGVSRIPPPADAASGS